MPPCRSSKFWNGFELESRIVNAGCFWRRQTRPSLGRQERAEDPGHSNWYLITIENFIHELRFSVAIDFPTKRSLKHLYKFGLSFMWLFFWQAPILAWPLSLMTWDRPRHWLSPVVETDQSGCLTRGHLHRILGKLSVRHLAQFRWISALCLFSFSVISNGSFIICFC